MITRKRTALTSAALLLAATGALALGNRHTEQTIDGFRDHIQAQASPPATTLAAAELERLPAPVQRFFAYSFRAAPPTAKSVSVEMAGDFRRPGSEDFHPTTAEQLLTIDAPRLVFSATTPVLPGVWARAYDAYADGEMDMKAKILGAVTVMSEVGSPELNRISLRRWLLESAYMPQALLPGGPVRWEPIDERRARAVVEADGLSASLVATFRADGSLERFDAETDGDLDTPYHGSGEHVLREDYREVDGVMIPHRFVIARAAGGVTYPFWRATVERVAFH